MLELTPFLTGELSSLPLPDQWLRGGFPPLALEPARFPTWAQDYLRNLAQRDLPLWGWPATPQVTDRFLRMLRVLVSQVESSALGVRQASCNPRQLLNLLHRFS